MTVIEKNSGTKIPYEVVKNKICFDDDLTINLAKREDDRDVHIDVCYDSYGELVIGAAAGRSYVAEIDIPARQYTQPEPIEEVTTDGEESAEGGTRMGNGTPAEPIPFSMNNVTLTLWAID